MTNKHLELCIHHHQGLGDHFDMNGMVRNYLKDYNKVHVFAKSNYYGMIEHMYRDQDAIKVIKIPKNANEVEFAENYYRENKDCTKFLRIGFENYPFHEEHLYNKNCWEFFYEQVNVPYNIHTDMFYVQRDPEEENKLMKELNPNNKKYIFIHEDKERGFELNRNHFLDKTLLTIGNDNTKNIFHFIKIIENAQEIHCMESSFKSLIDVYATTDNIFHHDLRKDHNGNGHPIGTRNNKKWKVVEYKKGVRNDY